MLIAFSLSRLVGMPLSTVVLAYVSPTPLPAVERLPQATMECRRNGGSVENWHEQRNNQEIRWRARWSGDDCSIDLRANGAVKFNNDFTDIASISDDGSLDLTENQGRTTRRLSLKSDNGRLLRTWSINGRDQPWD